MLITFLKLGGSLITDKTRPFTPRPDVLKRLAGEIVAARALDPSLRLVIGHGSGSFGHVVASQYHTRQGVHTQEEWSGFGKVWQSASTLHRIVIESFLAEQIPVISFPPSAGVTAHKGHIQAWNLEPLQAVLVNGLVPVIYGDVVFDTAMGGTILSTEDLFQYLAPLLSVKRILLAGIEPGVWANFPEKKKLIEQITPESFAQNDSGITGSLATDVTGGMRQKVGQMLTAVQENHGMQVLIFSGEIPGAVQAALAGKAKGTAISG